MPAPTSTATNPPNSLPDRPRSLERIAETATAWTERWMPDAFVFALAGTLLIAALALYFDPAVAANPALLVDAWGSGFWSLIPFTLQMAMMIIGGYVLATAPPVAKLVTRLAMMPKTGKGAVVLVSLVAMSSSLFNWGFSLIVSAVLAREIGRRLPTADYRALGAASFLGLGTVWAQGLSSSAALQMASASSMPPQLARVAGVIPLTNSIFTWQSVLCVVIEMAVVTLLMWLCTPKESRHGFASLSNLGAEEGHGERSRPRTPGEYFEHSPILVLPIVALGFLYLGRTLLARSSSLSSALSAIDFNNTNLMFLMVGALLHWTPASLARAVKDGTPAVAGVLLQYPFYAGIFGLITSTHLSGAMADLFVKGSSTAWFPATVLTYSGVLGLAVPSGGAKWMIEAPYLLESARVLQVPAGWIVVTYNLGEAIANLLQPFWMLPILGLLGLKARDIMGYTYLVALVLFPVAVVLVTMLRPSW